VNAKKLLLSELSNLHAHWRPASALIWRRWHRAAEVTAPHLYMYKSKRERFIAVLAADTMFVNVYFPCVSTLEEYEEAL